MLLYNFTAVTGVNLLVSHTHDQAAPTMTQLGGPVDTILATPIFDYATGRTSIVSAPTGHTRTADGRE